MRDPANELARSLRRRKIPRISRETRRRFVRALRQPCRPRSAPTIPIDLLLPPNLRQWLPESHLAYQIGDLVDAFRPEVLLRSLQRRRAPQLPLQAQDDGHGSALRLRHRDLIVVPDRPEAGGGHRLPLRGGRGNILGVVRLDVTEEEQQL